MAAQEDNGELARSQLNRTAVSCAAQRRGQDDNGGLARRRKRFRGGRGPSGTLSAFDWFGLSGAFFDGEGGGEPAVFGDGDDVAAAAGGSAGNEVDLK